MIAVRLAREEDRPRLLEICVAAFAPIHAGWEAEVGPDIFARAFGDWRAGYARHLAQARLDAPEEAILVAEVAGEVAGFVTVLADAETGLGEVGLNAVAPDWQRRGVGRRLYEAALDRMRAAGMRAATVGTGGDAAHAPARAAYESLGFDRSIPGVHYYRAL